MVSPPRNTVSISPPRSSRPPLPGRPRRGSVQVGLATGWWSALACVLWALAAPAALAATLTAAFDPDTVAVGEATELKLIYANGEPTQVPNLPQVPGLVIRQRPGISRGSSWINGVSSSQLTLTYQVTASRAGTYTLPAVSSVVNNQAITSAPVQLVVTAADGAASERPLAFLKLVVPRNEAYVGEILPLEVRLEIRLQHPCSIAHRGGPPRARRVRRP